LLVFLYMLYMLGRAWVNPAVAPASNRLEVSVNWWAVLQGFVPPLVLIFAVLGSILAGIATPTEAASVGAVGAMALAAMNRAMSLETLKASLTTTLQTTSLVFMIFIGAAFFALVFKGFGGDELVKSWLEALPGGVVTAMILVMLLMFVLGFFLDFIELTFVVVPIVAPILLAMGLDPIWLGVMIAMNLQTSFLTPPFGFSLFYLRGVAPSRVATTDMYKGVMPFIAIQLGMLVILALYPQLVTWLPSVL